MIAGADDISVQEYQTLGYQCVIYATSPITAAVDGYQRIYTSLRDTGHIGINAQQVQQIRSEVETLINLPEYQQVEAETTEREFQDRAHH